MGYEVPKMTLIPQQLSDSCWFACARMLITWRENVSGTCRIDLKSPEHDKASRDLRDLNRGITNEGLVAMAQRLGLKTVPPMTPTTGAVEDWLRSYGPLWVNGTSHIVVIAGIREALGGDHDLLVYDPWPVTRGVISWRSWRNWYEDDLSSTPIPQTVNPDTDSSRDTSAAAQAIFLHCPA